MPTVVKPRERIWPRDIQEGADSIKAEMGSVMTQELTSGKKFSMAKAASQVIGKIKFAITEERTHPALDTYSTARTIKEIADGKRPDDLPKHVLPQLLNYGYEERTDVTDAEGKQVLYTTTKQAGTNATIAEFAEHYRYELLDAYVTASLGPDATAADRLRFTQSLSDKDIINYSSRFGNLRAAG